MMHHRHEQSHDHDDVFTWPRLYDWAGRVCTLGAHARVCARAAELLAPHAPESVLDVGSGTGALSIALRRRYPTSQVIGVEPGTAMIAQARGKAAREGLDIEFRQGYGQRLPVPDDAVAAVTISLALHHVAEGQVPEVLAEVRRVLRPGGVLVVVEFAPVGRAARLASPPAHGHGLTEYSAHIRRAGFVGVRAGRVTSRMIRYVSGLAPRADARVGSVGGEDR